jgi:hypothetical protein
MKKRLTTIMMKYYNKKKIKRNKMLKMRIIMNIISLMITRRSNQKSPKRKLRTMKMKTSPRTAMTKGTRAWQ